MELRGGIKIILHQAFDGCHLLDCIRVPCKALAITGSGGGQDFVLKKDRFIPKTSRKKLAISSEFFNSIRPAEMSGMETTIMGILGEEIMQSDGPWYKDLQYLQRMGREMPEAPWNTGVLRRRAQ